MGSPREVIDRNLHQHERFGHQCTLPQLTVGVMPHDEVMRAIELPGTVAAPAAHAQVARRTAGADIAKQR